MTPEKGEFRMSVSAFDDRATSWLRVTQETRARVEGKNIRAMREPLSRELGVSTSKFERLVKGRFKQVPTWLYERIRMGMVNALEAELKRLENELHVARLCSMAPDDDDILSAQDNLKAARSLIKAVTK
jgi:hypothetical protein